MPPFLIIDESTEDTLGGADQLPAAIHLAREALQLGQTGALVSILDDRGMAVGQFVRMADGTIEEQRIATLAKPEARAGQNGTAPIPASALPRS